ncbi:MULTISPECIES: hypothetical protein [unclassified Sphingomonas]|uniref:hypothetical protein n=1 Tax=unclassified Sphingomonas TaxID=196159 RepID=UPI00286040A0|nr:MULTISPECIES: hypothetical protein [unclassified Sphingomonas]MDR6114775.1 hypothetical protein [Sphingomonas sp. SORGH_AS_0789]MDR6151552.1 hypothetical protein [Sphingomonas sp. SORGH_AS_0742]
MMRKAVMMLGLGVALAAWTPGQTRPAPDATSCQLPPGWDQVAARGARIVVFGEVHGTRESPAFVGSLACALAAKGERILVAVEHFSLVDGDYQKAWDLPDTAFVPALIKSGWAGREDGVASEAMLAMLVQLHSLSQAGRKIDIVAFSGVKDKAQARKLANLPSLQGQHDASQAENIREAAARHPYDHVLVLAGNMHARKQPVTYSSPAYEPMAMRLGRSVPLLTLNMKVAGGTTWTCELRANGNNAEDSECAAHSVGADADLKRKPFVALGALPGEQLDPDYDGVYWLGSVTASPPAVPVQNLKRKP